MDWYLLLITWKDRIPLKWGNAREIEINQLVYTSHMEDNEKFITKTKNKKTQVRADSKIEFNFF